MVTCLICKYKRGELVHVYFHFDTLDYVKLATFYNCLGMMHNCRWIPYIITLTDTKLKEDSFTSNIDEYVF